MTRFYESPAWRFIVTDLNTRTLTFLDRHAANRGVTYTLNRPAVAVGTVASDDPEINIPDVDGDPFLNNSNRLLYGFRREDRLGFPWWVRYGGIIMPIQDVASTGQPTTTYTAYDPWQYLYNRPMLRADGTLPGQNGIHYNGVAGSQIALDLLTATRDANGITRIDFDSPYYTGTITPTSPISIQFQQGISVGEAWDQLIDEGDMDIVLTPIYDPFFRPGFCCELNISPQYGITNYSAVMAWDMPSRSLGGIDHLVDGSQLANVFQPYVGQGGVAGTQYSGTTVGTYGEYWAQQFFPGQNIKIAVELTAQAQLAMRANGKETLQISPAPERSPLPFQDYWLGDSVPVWASDRLRKPIQTVQRVYSIPLQISDDQLEHVDNLLLSPEGS